MRPRSRSFKAVVAAALIASGLLVGCSSHPDAGGTSTAEIAYVTAAGAGQDEFGLAQGTDVVARPAGDFDGDEAWDGGPVWTLDDRFVVAVSDVPGHLEGQALVVIDAASGSVRTIPCEACQSVAAIGAGKLLVSVDPASASAGGNSTGGGGESGANKLTVLEVDLESSAKPGQLITNLVTDGFSTIRFIASTSDAVLVAASPQDTNQADQLFLLQPDGSVKSLGSSQSSSSTGPATAVSPQSGQPVFAVNGGWPNFVADEGEGHIFLLDARSGKRTYTDISALAPPQIFPSSAVQIEMYDMWTGPDGNLYATMGVAVQPGYTGPPVHAIPQSLWRLDHNRWIRVDSGSTPTQSVRQFGGGGEFVLVPTAGQDYGTLDAMESGKRAVLANYVDRISSPS
jgi:hypothetical protein